MPVEVVIDRGGCAAVRVDRLVDQVELKNANRIGERGDPYISPAFASSAASV